MNNNRKKAQEYKQSKSNGQRYNKKFSKGKNSYSKDKLDKQSAEELSKAANEPEFYFRYPELMKHVTNIPFNVIANLPAPLSNEGTFNYPNVVILEIQPLSPCAPTASAQRNTNMNQFMQDFYAAVRRENSGARNYDPADLTRFIFAMAEVFKRINFLQRFYYMMNYYSPINRAFPIMLFDMMNIDYKSFRDNQAEFAARLDTLITRAATMFVPSDVMYLKRMAMIYSKYYIDTEDQRDTIYVPMPAYEKSFLTLDATENLIWDNGGMQNPATRATTMDDLMTSAEQFVDKVLSSQDFGIMQGDILHAFPNANYTKLQALDPKVSMPPVYDKAMLMQFHNADILYWSNYNQAGKPWLGFDTNGLPIGSYQFNPATAYATRACYEERAASEVGVHPSSGADRKEAFLCLDSETTSPEWIVECTRMKAECGIDCIASLRVYMALDSDVVDEIASKWGTTVSDADRDARKGSFPYIPVCANGNYEQHNTAYSWIDSINSTWSTTSVPLNKTDPFFGQFSARFERGRWEISNTWLMPICRYLPYRALAFRWYYNAASSTAVMPVINTAHTPWTVITSMPIIQPIDIPNLRRLDNVCWRSLLSWK
jgi:hypothetical protein